jgi:hypothetical protein
MLIEQSVEPLHFTKRKRSYAKLWFTNQEGPLMPRRFA